MTGRPDGNAVTAAHKRVGNRRRGTQDATAKVRYSSPPRMEVEIVEVATGDERDRENMVPTVSLVVTSTGTDSTSAPVANR